MAQIQKPLDINKVWASGGDVLTPSDTKIATGWQLEIPPRQYFNYIDQKQDYAIAHINQHGIAVWDSTTEYQANKSYAQGPTNGTIYRSKETHTNQNPETDVSNTYWDVAFAGAGDFYTKAEVDGAFLSKAANGSDILNAATFRNNISVYSQAQTYTRSEVDAKTTVASTAQAQAGASNTVLMTPLRTKEWADSKVLGINQTWQDLTASRALNTTYTNTTDRPIQLMVDVRDSGGVGSLTFDINGITWTVTDLVGGDGTPILFSPIIPANNTYRLASSGGTNLRKWLELR